MLAAIDGRVMDAMSRMTDGHSSGNRISAIMMMTGERERMTGECIMRIRRAGKTVLDRQQHSEAMLELLVIGSTIST